MPAHCCSSPLAAVARDDDGDVLLSPVADAAVPAAAHPAPARNALLAAAAAAAGALPQPAATAAADVHDAACVVASAMCADAVMTSADAEPLSGQADCDAGASVPPVPTDAQTGADSDSDGDDSTVMLDVDADCRSVEADASVQRQQCAAPVLSAETDAVWESKATVQETRLQRGCPAAASMAYEWRRPRPTAAARDATSAARTTSGREERTQLLPAVMSAVSEARWRTACWSHEGVTMLTMTSAAVRRRRRETPETGRRRLQNAQAATAGVRKLRAAWQLR